MEKRRRPWGGGNRHQRAVRGTAVAREGGKEVVQAEGDLEAHLLEPEGKAAHAHAKPPPNVG
jgi:hypothetical protein